MVKENVGILNKINEGSDDLIRLNKLRVRQVSEELNVESKYISESNKQRTKRLGQINLKKIINQMNYDFKD